MDEPPLYIYIFFHLVFLLTIQNDSLISSLPLYSINLQLRVPYNNYAIVYFEGFSLIDIVGIGLHILLAFVYCRAQLNGRYLRSCNSVVP